MSFADRHVDGTHLFMKRIQLPRQLDKPGKAWKTKMNKFWRVEHGWTLQNKVFSNQDKGHLFGFLQ